MSVPAFPSLLAFGLPSGWEWIVILAIGLLIFGRRLPEVSRSIGKSIVEFKRGLKNIQDEVEEESDRPSGSSSSRPGELPGGTGGDPAGHADAREKATSASSSSGGESNPYRPNDA